MLSSALRQMPPPLLPPRCWLLFPTRLLLPQVGRPLEQFITTSYHPPFAHVAMTYGLILLLCAERSTAPLRASPRVDSDGQRLCELCPRRLSSVKGKLHRHGPGHICQKCYNQQRLPRAGEATEAAPPS